MATSFLNRMLATDDGSTGITPVGADGDQVRNIADRTGRSWVRLWNGAGEVSSSNPLSVSVGSSTLPLGAATAALQTSGNASLTSIDGKVTGLATQTTLGQVHTDTTATAAVLGTTSDAVDLDGSGSATISARTRGLIEWVSGAASHGGKVGAAVRGPDDVGASPVGGVYPVRGGGIAYDVTALPSYATTNVVDTAHSAGGEVYAYLSRQIAGEDITNNQMGIVPVINALTTVNKYTRSTSTGTSTSTQSTKTAAGNLFYLRGTNVSAVAAYLFVIDKSSAAANGDAPIIAPIPVPAGGSGGDEWPMVGLTCVNGIQVAWSSTVATLTLVSTGPLYTLYK